MKTKKLCMRVGLVLVPAVIVVAAWAILAPPPAKPIRLDAAALAAGSGPFSYQNYAEALKTFVNDQGMVDYKGLKASSKALDAFLAALGALDPKTFAAWAEKEKIAFWINAYNACTLKAIIANYPIRSSAVASLRFPKNSIRQISGVWTALQFRVLGEEVTLDAIEHQRLRAQFNEPRIHVALVCAAMGCPPLRNEPFVADRLDAQLDDQTKRFLAAPAKFRIDREKGVVHLSSIFKWFADDFVRTYGVERPARHGESVRAVLNFIARSLAKENAEYLVSGDYSVSYLDYDWSLNEQKQP
jgi:hypothetical protein